MWRNREKANMKTEGLSDASTSQGTPEATRSKKKDMKQFFPWHFLVECGPLNTSLYNFWPPELKTKGFSCFKPLDFWYFVRAALGNPHTFFLL